MSSDKMERYHLNLISNVIKKLVAAGVITHEESIELILDSAKEAGL